MKYYAVRNGKIPGIYTSWDACKAQINGFSGAIFKAFPLKADAEAFVGVVGVVGGVGGVVEEKKNIEGISLPQVYFDGSCQDSKAGGACLVGNTVFYRRVEGEQTNNRGELTGLLLALENSSGDIEICGDSLYAMNVGNGDWKHKNNHDLVEKIRGVIKGRKIKWTHVYGHTGVKKNEICDKYAGLSLSNDDYETYGIELE